MSEVKQKIGLIGVTVAVFIVAQTCGSQFLALAASSENFQIEKDTLNFGGGHSESGTFLSEDTLGEAATGEGLESGNYGACSGFQCMGAANYLSFSVKEGTTKPGVTGAGVDLGLLDAGTIVTSDGSTVNSIFVTAESSANYGLTVSVRGKYGGLAKLSATDKKIVSTTETLTIGDEGYGLCVFSATEAAASPTTFEPVSPYSSSCDKLSEHQVGAVDDVSRTIIQSSGKLTGGDAEILVKAAVGSLTVAGQDYQDTLTFIATATY